MGDSPRSPPLVAQVQEHHQQHTRSSPEDQLKSPRLVKGAASAGQQANKGLLGYTVAHYGEGEPYPGVPGASPGEPEEQALKPHKYFDRIEVGSSSKVPQESEWTRPFLPESETAQFEMTRSAELTLFKERREQSPPRFQPINTRRAGEEAYATVMEHNKHGYAHQQQQEDMPCPKKFKK
uniref:Uncharacterized protein n=1 Tax=Ditylenchus dipsaci TaxID=166011 RepID=A0A915CMI4_9BILA